MLKLIKQTRLVKWFRCVRRSLPSTRYMIIVSETDHRLSGSLEDAKKYIELNKLPADLLVVPVWISDVEIIARSGGSAAEIDN